ncbi:MAG: hypothetical protein E6J52_08560 [Chloroflexi bacterium]|nr:MAG: hypothetical protein E6J52_08560 [Chloroflexota bacterium]
MKRAVALFLLASLALNFTPLVVSAHPATCDEADPGTPGCVASPATSSSGIARTHRIDPTCPPPTTTHGGQCVITQDLQLSETLELASDTKLNCQDHRLTPSSANPEVGVVIIRSYGVKLQNCVIEGFLFGVVVVDAKMPADYRAHPNNDDPRRNKILDNRITGAEGILVIKSDALEISGNEITMTSNGGDGLRLYRDSDFNHIVNNRITDVATGEGYGYLVPGQLDVILCLCASAMFVANGLDITEPRGSSLSVRVGSTTIDFPWEAANSPEDNVFEANHISLPREFISVGITFGDGNRRPVVRGNVIQGSWIGIAASGNFTDTVDARSVDGIVEDNIVTDARDGIQVIAAYNTTVRRNFVSGAARAGILLVEAALATSAVTRNTLSGNAFGFSFSNISSTRVGAAVYLNDVTGSSVRAIRTSGPAFTQPSDLSFAGRGNYWGRTCADGGFLASDTPSSLITDGHPFGQPVASVPDALLPAPCR